MNESQSQKFIFSICSKNVEVVTNTLTLCLRETQISVLASRTLSAGNTDYIHRNTRLCMRETEISVFKMLHIGLKLVDFYNDIYRYFV